jgi:hypothetical protein
MTATYKHQLEEAEPQTTKYSEGLTLPQIQQESTALNTDKESVESIKFSNLKGKRFKEPSETPEHPTWSLAPKLSMDPGEYLTYHD